MPSSTWPQHRMLELAPLNWARTVALDEVQELLGANPYRTAVIKTAAARA